MRVERLPDNPIIHPDMPGLAGELGANINGPSLLRVPEWVERPLGQYYMYFAHHQGAFIRMAYADALAGPWTVHEPGVLHMDQGPGRKHIASPDLHVYPDRREIRMYFHMPRPRGTKHWGRCRSRRSRRTGSILPCGPRSWASRTSAFSSTAAGTTRWPSTTMSTGCSTARATG